MVLGKTGETRRKSLRKRERDESARVRNVSGFLRLVPHEKAWRRVPKGKRLAKKGGGMGVGGIFGIWLRGGRLPLA